MCGIIMGSIKMYSKLVIIALTVVTVIYGVSLSVWAINGGDREFGMCFAAKELSGRVEGWYEILDPDEYVLQAINNPGSLIVVNQNKTRYWAQLNQAAEEGYEGVYIRKYGKCWGIDIIYSDPELGYTGNHLIVVGFLLGSAWIAVAIIGCRVYPKLS